LNIEQVEELLRKAARPAEPPDRLARAILAIAGGPRARASRRRFLLTGALAVAIVLAGATALRTQPAGFQAVTTVQLQGAGGTAEARLGTAYGPNRPVQLRVEHLHPGQERYFELWSLREQPPMMLATFMTDTNGSCVITFSTPAAIDWRDIVITPRGQATDYVLCSNATSCG
jgi:hypothetical protein